MFPTSTDAILKELGNRLARYRLNRNMTQQSLAEEAGVSLPTIQRLEKGHSTQLTNLLKILTALKLAENLDTFIPEPPASPLQTLKMQGKERRRASSLVKEKETDPWTWGDHK